jgi:hypothetical protein
MTVNSNINRVAEIIVFEREGVHEQREPGVIRPGRRGVV